MVAKLRLTSRKAMYEHMDVDTAMTVLHEHEHSYIVAERFLVAYELGCPWYCKPGTLWLNEMLVLRLAVSGASDFTIVPAFLESRAREAGASLAIAGTALAKSDKALASLYHKAGFKTQALTLIKEP